MSKELVSFITDDVDGWYVGPEDGAGPWCVGEIVDVGQLKGEQEGEFFIVRLAEDCEALQGGEETVLQEGEKIGVLIRGQIAQFATYRGPVRLRTKGKTHNKKTDRSFWRYEFMGDPSLRDVEHEANAIS